jgi:hypothetical protein
MFCAIYDTRDRPMSGFLQNWTGVIATILRMCIWEFQTQIPAIFMTNTQHDKFPKFPMKYTAQAVPYYNKKKIFTVTTNVKKKKLWHAQFVIL